MAQIIQYIDTPLVAGEEYQLTFNTDITEGILVVKQGSTIIYQSDHVSFGGVGSVYETVHVTDYVYMNRVTRSEDYDSITVSEDVQFEIVSYIDVYSESTSTESFEGAVINYVG